MASPSVQAALRRATVLVMVAAISNAASSAGLAVIVNPAASFTSLDVNEISPLFLGKTNAFPDGKIAVPANQAEGELRAEFNEKVLHKDPTALKTYWAKMQFTGKAVLPRELSGDAEIKKFVASTPGAIGYIDKSSADSSVKVVATF